MHRQIQEPLLLATFKASGFPLLPLVLKHYLGDSETRHYKELQFPWKWSRSIKDWLGQWFSIIRQCIKTRDMFLTPTYSI